MDWMVRLGEELSSSFENENDIEIAVVKVDDAKLWCNASEINNDGFIWISSLAHLVSFRFAFFSLLRKEIALDKNTLDRKPLQFISNSNGLHLPLSLFRKGQWIYSNKYILCNTCKSLAEPSHSTIGRWIFCLSQSGFSSFFPICLIQYYWCQVFQLQRAFRWYLRTFTEFSIFIGWFSGNGIIHMNMEHWVFNEKK